MPAPLVVAARLFQFSLMKYFFAIACLSCASSFAQDLLLEQPQVWIPTEIQLPLTADGEVAIGYLARLDEKTPQGLKKALDRAEMLFWDGRLDGIVPPASFVLHGPEVAVFFKENYSANKELMDLAARLTAFGVVNIKVCETQAGVLGRDKSNLLPFVGTVSFGPAEELRLIQQEGYLQF